MRLQVDPDLAAPSAAGHCAFAFAYEPFLAVAIRGLDQDMDVALAEVRAEEISDGCAAGADLHDLDVDGDVGLGLGVLQLFPCHGRLELILKFLDDEGVHGIGDAGLAGDLADLESFGGDG